MIVQMKTHYCKMMDPSVALVVMLFLGDGVTCAPLDFCLSCLSHIQSAHALI